MIHRIRTDFTHFCPDEKVYFVCDCRGSRGQPLDFTAFICYNGHANFILQRFHNLAKNFSVIQNGGILERYVDAARDTAKRNNVNVCDIYAKWKAMAAGGVNVTELLASKLNHPTREMSWMTAYSLVETMFDL